MSILYLSHEECAVDTSPVITNKLSYCHVNILRRSINVDIK